jgi:hypothetical protein
MTAGQEVARNTAAVYSSEVAEPSVHTAVEVADIVVAAD